MSAISLGAWGGADPPRAELETLVVVDSTFARLGTAAIQLSNLTHLSLSGAEFFKKFDILFLLSPTTLPSLRVFGSDLGVPREIEHELRHAIGRIAPQLDTLFLPFPGFITTVAGLLHGRFGGKMLLEAIANKTLFDVLSISFVREWGKAGEQAANRCIRHLRLNNYGGKNVDGEKFSLDDLADLVEEGIVRPRGLRSVLFLAEVAEAR